MVVKVAVPGQLLVSQFDKDDEGNGVEYLAGSGTKVEEKQWDNGQRTNVILSTVLGKVTVAPVASVAPTTDTDTKETLVKKRFTITVAGKNNGDSTVLPVENDIVLCRVIKINSRQASVEIIAIENKGVVNRDSGISLNEISQGQQQATYSSVASTSLSNNASDIGENFKGLIRLQDIRLTERDKLKMAENFKPGDVLRAKIISKGDGSNYYLTTASNDLGVVFARAKNGQGDVMYALDWQNMIEISTGDTELRKCAKPFV